MNIVQLQYKLRDLPMSAVQAAANGQNPSIPELLATMELNRRQRLENSGAQAPTKSVKEQLEEKLTSRPQEQMGLPAVMQQAQQANGEPQQEEVQQAGQPQQPQGNARMAGVAGLPSGGAFKQFNNGGIVAFAEGDLVANEDQSAAEVARLKQAEEMAAARELLEMTGGNRPAAPARQAPQAPALPPEVIQANQIIEQTPYNREAAEALRALPKNIEVTTPQQKMAERQALYEQFGIRPPGEDELARVKSSNEAYEKDRQARTEFQAQQALARAARPNAWGKYMPGSIGETTSTFGLANLDADRTFREANAKAEVAAKESQRAFKLGDLNTAITAVQKEKEAMQEANKASAVGLGQMASYASSAMGQLMTNAENKRYHDMWKDIQDKDLKLKAAQLAQATKSNIPEVMRLLDGLEKKFPELMKSMTPDQRLNYVADQMARQRGSEGTEAKLNVKLQEDYNKAIKADSIIMSLSSKLSKAYKNNSQIEIDDINRQIEDRKAQIKKDFAPIAVGTTGGISTLPQGGANTASSGSTMKYDAKGNRIP